MSRKALIIFINIAVLLGVGLYFVFSFGADKKIVNMALV